MANPYVSLGNYNYDPSAPVIERHYFTMVDFSSTQFFTYKEAERDGTDFVPQGDKFIYFENLYDAIVDKPDFIDDLTWDASGSGGLSKSPSGFLTGANSVMPKLIVPTKLLVDNGIANAEDVTKTGLMAWTTPLSETKLTVGGDVGSKFISFNKKNDDESNSYSLNVQEAGLNGVSDYADYIYYLNNLDSIDDIGFNAGDSLVGSGAFMITVNVIPTEKGGQSTNDASESKWKVVMDTTATGGELTMTLDESGSLVININGQITKAQLSEAKAKDNAPQNSKIKEGHKYDIVVYPVWNGVVVSSGVQDSSAAVKTGSQYCIMNKKAHIMTSPWSDGFSADDAKDDPESYEVRVASDDVEMLTNWKPSTTEASKLNVTTTNCRVDTYFVPLFFSQNCKFDVYSLVTKDSDEITHDYYIHPIYTRNGNTGSRLRYEKDSYSYDYNDDNEFIRFSFEMFLKKDGTDDEVGVPGRRGGEIFGYVYHVKETTTYSSVNGNGAFPVSSSFWSSGTAGDENYSGNWQDYIQNVSVNYGMDGSSGSLSIDKYGCAGQYAKANQLIGSITVDVLEMNDAGRIFTGIVEGIAETNDSGGAEFNLTLNGLNRKLEDIILINVPFFDGYTLQDVCDFLCDYGGLDADYTYADVTCKLPSSTDINSPIIDFKTGTPVMQALQQVMEQTHHWFIIQPDGKIYFYELSTDDSLPVTLGTDWSSTYPDYNVIMANNQQPDFEDIRNEIVVIGLKQIGGTNTSLKDFQLFPIVTWEKQTTNPSYPWSRPIVYPVKGFVTQETLEKVYNNIKGFTKKYEIQGNLTIPGNSNIKVYDTWTMNSKQYVITSVTHNVDLQSKSWTTDLEFATGRGW